MAETSGFFQAMMDEETGDYDRRYLAKQFSDYFALFIKNGVFGSPTNQLLVGPGSSGLSVVVKAGNAFIDGMWYNNSTDKEIFIVPNYESQVRVDTVRVRMSQITRSIVVDVFTGDSDLQRGEDIYDLQLATVNVQPFAEKLTAANIRDTRPDESVCGFVSQLLEVQTTADLFAQYQAKFDEWFAGVQGTLGEDAAGNLLTMIGETNNKVLELETAQEQFVKNLDIQSWIVSKHLSNSQTTIQRAMEIDLMPELTANDRNAYDVMFVMFKWYGESNGYGSSYTGILFRDSALTLNLGARFPIPRRQVYVKNSSGTYEQDMDAEKIENPYYSRTVNLLMAGESFLKLSIGECYLFEEDAGNTIWYRDQDRLYPRGCVVSDIYMQCIPRLKK